MRRFIGDKAFYKRVLLLVIPIMLQNLITNFVSMLDNIMVGRLGTEQMSGVAIVNQFVFVFTLLIFGAVSGAGIFCAQFYGNGDNKGIRDTFRFKILLCAALTVLSYVFFIVFGEELIKLYLMDESSGDVEATLRYGKEYLSMIMWEIVPFVIVQIYAGTLRETQKPLVPMVAGIVAVFVNLTLNYVFIYGNFGAPKMGVSGAALATTISRVIECVIVVGWTHKNGEKNPFIKGAYRSFKLPGDLAKKIMIKGTPLMLNEVLWAGGIAVINQCFSARGLNVVAAMNISSVISNLTGVVFVAMGTCASIVVGQHLGANEFEEAKDSANKVIAFSVAMTLVSSVILFCMAGVFPKAYNTSETVRDIATKLIMVIACFQPIHAFLNASYFTIRAGGKTVITFCMDSLYSWVVAIPVAYCIVNFGHFDIITSYALYCCVDIFKAMIAYILLKKEVWVQNIIEA